MESYLNNQFGQFGNGFQHQFGGQHDQLFGGAQSFGQDLLGQAGFGNQLQGFNQFDSHNQFGGQFDQFYAQHNNQHHGLSQGFGQQSQFSDFSQFPQQSFASFGQGF
jgi:hypothetical protein